MKCWGGIGTTAVLVTLGAGLALAQEAAITPAAADTVTAQAKVYDVGPDVTTPELLPVKWDVTAVDTCKETREGSVSLVLVVDAEGVPQKIAALNPQGTTLEKMALRIAGADRFKPGTLKGDPVAVKLKLELDIKGCFATKTDEAGNTTDVFRLTAQPDQQFVGSTLPALHVPFPDTGAAQPLSPGMYRVGHGVSAPVALNSIEAKYSDEARRKGISGVCLVSMIVDAQGNPQNPRIIRALGSGLDEKAIEAVKKYHFKPAMKEDGTPVPVMITVEVNFRLYVKGE